MHLKITKAFATLATDAAARGVPEATGFAVLPLPLVCAPGGRRYALVPPCKGKAGKRACDELFHALYVEVAYYEGHAEYMPRTHPFVAYLATVRKAKAAT